MRAFETGCYGNAAVRTPSLDRLAAQGVRFETAVSNTPVCMAARSALLSGQYARTCNGYLENDWTSTGGKGLGALEPEWPEEKRGARLPGTTLPEALGRAGYRCQAVGKWHIRPSPRAVGFDGSVLPLNNHRHSGQSFRVDGGAPTPFDGFSPQGEIEAVERYLAGRAGQPDPFFLYYNIMPPHMPLGDMPERYRALHAPDQIDLRPNVEIDGRLPHSEEWFRIYLWDYAYYHHREGHTLDLPAGFDIRALTALYYGAVAWVDDTVGRLLRALEANGLAKNTILVFTSDHGDNLGSHHRWNKGVLLEESIRVPLLWRFPGRWAPGVNRSQAAGLVDIMPTLLEACGVEAPDGVQGQSLLPLLGGERDRLERDWAFIETPASLHGDGCTEIGVRTPTHLCGMRLEAGGRRVADPDYMFHDLGRDPYQLDNLAAPGRTSALQTRLKQRLLAWHRDTPWLEEPDCGPDRTRLFDADGLPRPGADHT